MRPLVTGASGHVGGALVRALLDRGDPVRTLIHNDRRAVEGLAVDMVQGDIRDPSSLRRAFQDIDIVFHAAGHISLTMDEWPRLEALNVTGTRNVVEARLHCGVRRLVHFSSIEALQTEPLHEPIDESRPLVNSDRAPPYNRSKAASEREVRRGVEQGLEAVILNPTAVIGPYDFGPSHFGEVLLALARGQLPALVRGGFDWVDVRDAAEGAVRAAERDQPGAKYILSGHWVSIRDIAEMIEHLTDQPVPRVVFPMWAARLALPFASPLLRLTEDRPLYTRASLRALRANRDVCHGLATRELGYEPRPFRETIADTLRWFDEAGLLPQAAVEQEKAK